MALGTNNLGITHATGSDPGGFVPTKWIDEAIVTYQSNLALGDKIKRIDFKGQKGDAINIPSLTDRGSPSAKAENDQVTLVTRADGEVILSLDKHYEYSFLIEDRVSIQAVDSLLREYMEDAGYGLAKQIDQDIWMAFKNMNGGATSFAGAVIGSDGETLWGGAAGTAGANAAALTDAGIRKIVQTLDDSDNPMTNRHLVIPPVERNNMMGLARFTEQAFIGNGNTIRNGVIGNIYGVDVAVSTNCPSVHTDANEDMFTFSTTAPADGSSTDAAGDSYTASSAAIAGRVAAMFHKDSVCMADQLDIRLQKQYKQEYLGDLHTADTLYGVVEARDYGCVPIIVAD